MRNNTINNNENILVKENEKILIYIKILASITHLHGRFDINNLRNSIETIEYIIENFFIVNDKSTINSNSKNFLDIWLIGCEIFELECKGGTFSEKNIINLIRNIYEKINMIELKNTIEESNLIKNFIKIIDLIRINILSTDNEELKIYFKKENTEQIKITQETSTDIQNILNQKGD